MKNIIKYACLTPGFCRFFKTYEEAWKFTQAYFAETGRALCVEPVHA